MTGVVRCMVEQAHYEMMLSASPPRPPPPSTSPGYDVPLTTPGGGGGVVEGRLLALQDHHDSAVSPPPAYTVLDGPPPAVIPPPTPPTPDHPPRRPQPPPLGTSGETDRSAHSSASMFLLHSFACTSCKKVYHTYRQALSTARLCRTGRLATADTWFRTFVQVGSGLLRGNWQDLN